MMRALLSFLSFLTGLYLTLLYVLPSRSSVTSKRGSSFASASGDANRLDRRRYQHDARQAPNEWYAKDPLGQTASYNFTAFLLPLSKSMAANLVGGEESDLLQVRGIGSVLAEDQHPLVCMSGLLFDIRQAVLNIERLQSANCYLPFYDGAHDGSTPYTFDVINFQDKLVPVLAGSLQQSVRLLPANFDPESEAYRPVGSSAFAMDISLGVGGNNLLGLPVPNTPVLSLLWKRQEFDQGFDVSRFIQGTLEAPYVHTYSGLCSTTAWKFDEIFADPESVQGEVQLFPPITPRSMQFESVSGYKATASWDNQFGPGQSCASLKDQALQVRYE